MKIWIHDAVLTRPLAAGLPNLAGAELIVNPAPDAYAVIETARFAAFPDYRMHLTAGITVQNQGTIAFTSPVRADELEDPAIWIRTKTATAELVARATLKPFFGFTPSRWVAETTGGEAGVVLDEEAALMPIESGFREDLTRAWFVLTGLSLVTHLLAVPAKADPSETATVADWIARGGGLDESDRRSLITNLSTETGAEVESLTALFDDVNWTLEGEDRVAASELFIKSRVASDLGPIPWLT